MSAYESDNAGASMSIEELNADITAKQRVLEELINTLSKTQKNDENTQKLNNLDLDAKKKELDKAKEKLDKLKAENEGTEIVSKAELLRISL